jgi:hypothetical protein
MKLISGGKEVDSGDVTVRRIAKGQVLEVRAEQARDW